MASVSRFPDGFLWGAATSAYQIEGSPLADGAGASIWHRFTHTPGRTLNGDTGDVACDHYRRWKSDVALMRRLGLQAYRFSVSWGRVLPQGRGRVNRKGLDFYARLVDALLAAGIQPMVTLYHWDLPAVLDDLGGWRNRDSVGWFADYAGVMFGALGDRVPLWVTLNEPWVIAHDGYVTGCNAPGHRNRYEAPLVSHHLLMAHGEAVKRFRASDARGKIGLAVNLEPKDPASRRAEDVAATRRAHAYINEHYLDPVFRGRYPAALPKMFGDAWPAFPAADMRLMRQKLDFLAINYYTRKVVKADPTDWPAGGSGVRQPGRLMTTGWEVHPESFTRTLRWVRRRYGDVPLYVTENGATFREPAASPPGGLRDRFRIDYFRRHLAAARAAIRQGVDLRGYFAWSLMDNLEWSGGFTHRFGLVHVNFATLKRTPKASAAFYRDVIRSNGASLEAPATRGRVTARVARPRAASGRSPRRPS